MKKPNQFAFFVFLFAALAALAAWTVVMVRREKELSEYESLLFREEFAQNEAEPAAEAE